MQGDQSSSGEGNCRIWMLCGGPNHQSKKKCRGRLWTWLSSAPNPVFLLQARQPLFLIWTPLHADLACQNALLFALNPGPWEAFLGLPLELAVTGWDNCCGGDVSLEGLAAAFGPTQEAQLRMKNGWVTCSSGFLCPTVASWLRPSTEVLISVLAPDSSPPWGHVTAPSLLLLALGWK